MSKRIFIVEDERIVAIALERMLERAGFEVVGNVGDGARALEQAAAAEPDIILMDVNLGPGLDGIAAARQIREASSVPIVLVTAYNDPETMKRASDVTDLRLSKPLSSGAVVALLQDVFG